MRDATVLEPFGKIARDVARSVIAEQSWFVHDLALSQPEATNASSSVSVTSSARIVEHSFQAMM
jgi:hypothetical protein